MAALAPPIGAPIVSGSVIVIPLRTGVVAAYRFADGTLMWTREFSVEKPLAADAERVYIASGEAIHALNAASGEVAWRVPARGPVTAAPLAHAGWVIAAAAGELIAIRAADGNVIWRQQVGPVEFRPAIDGELLVAPLVDGHLLALDVRDGSTRWSVDFGASPGEPLAFAGRVYAGALDKYFHRHHASSGRREPPVHVGAMPRGAPAADDRHVYFAAMDNVLRAIDRGDGALEWKRGLTYRPAAGPVLLGKYVVVPGDVDALPVFDARTGAEAGKITFPALLAALPVFAAQPDGSFAVVAISGSHENKWAVSLLEPALVPPPAVQPLTFTALPGAVATLPSLPDPPKG